MGLINQRSTPLGKTATIESRTIDALVEDFKELNEGVKDVNSGLWTIDLMSVSTGDVYAPFSLKITSFSNVHGDADLDIKIDDVPYVLGADIIKGSKITFTVPTNGVNNVNYQKI